MFLTYCSDRNTISSLYFSLQFKLQRIYWWTGNAMSACHDGYQDEEDTTHLATPWTRFLFSIFSRPERRSCCTAPIFALLLNFKWPSSRREKFTYLSTLSFCFHFHPCHTDNSAVHFIFSFANCLLQAYFYDLKSCAFFHGPYLNGHAFFL